MAEAAVPWYASVPAPETSNKLTTPWVLRTNPCKEFDASIDVPAIWLLELMLSAIVPWPAAAPVFAVLKGTTVGEDEAENAITGDASSMPITTTMQTENLTMLLTEALLVMFVTISAATKLTMILT